MIPTLGDIFLPVNEGLGIFGVSSGLDDFQEDVLDPRRNFARSTGKKLVGKKLMQSPAVQMDRALPRHLACRP